MSFKVPMRFKRGVGEPRHFQHFKKPGRSFVTATTPQLVRNTNGWKKCLPNAATFLVFHHISPYFTNFSSNNLGRSRVTTCHNILQHLATCHNPPKKVALVTSGHIWSRRPRRSWAEVPAPCWARRSATATSQGFRRWRSWHPGCDCPGRSARRPGAFPVEIRRDRERFQRSSELGVWVCGVFFWFLDLVIGSQLKATRSACIFYTG